MTSRQVAGGLMAAALLVTATPAAAQRGPAAAAAKIPADVLALACAPRLTYQQPTVPLRVTGGQDSAIRYGFAPGDLVTINAGTTNGITVGQEFYVRRPQPTHYGAITPENPGIIQTTGWLRVYAVEEALSLATVTHSCDAIEINDYLEPFALPEVPKFSIDRSKPERDNYARVMVGLDRRRTFGKNDFITINRGSTQGVVLGSQFVLYRDKHQGDNFLFELGEAVAVEVMGETSTLLITTSNDAILLGDYVAMRKGETR